MPPGQQLVNALPVMLAGELKICNHPVVPAPAAAIVRPPRPRLGTNAPKRVSTLTHLHFHVASPFVYLASSTRQNMRGSIGAHPILR